MAYNIGFRSDNAIERQLSNLAFAHFFIEGRECNSFEGFYMGIKRSGDEIQNEIFKMFGFNAKNRTKKTKHIYFNGRTMQAGSKEHHELLFQAQVAKYTQHKESHDALMATGNTLLYHKVGRDSILYPARVFCRHLTTIRSMLRKGELKFVE